MTVVIQTRNRCRLCFSLLFRDRSLCCQKSYNLFKHIERRKFPIQKNSHLYRIKIRTPTVCFRDLIVRYLHTQIQQTRNYSNLICSDCSMILLDVEQCAKYLRKTINQLKMKLNKSNRLRTSSLSATLQKKKQPNSIMKEEQLPISNTDSDEEFDDIDDDQDDIEANMKLKSPLSLSSGGESSSKITSINNHQCNEEEEDDEDDDDEEEDGLIKSSFEQSQQQQQNIPEYFPSRNLLPGSIMNLSDETNRNIFQSHLTQMMTTPPMNSPNTGQHLNENHSLLNTFANIQRNLFLQFLNDPMATAQAAAAAAAAAVSSQQIKANLTPNQQTSSSSRKRKSPPGKRPPTNNNDDISPTIDDNNNNNNNSVNHPLELTNKTNRNSTSDIHNLVRHSKLENGSPIYQINDDERKEIMTPNESSLTLSPSLVRHTTTTPKRQRLSDYPTKLKINLLSPNNPTISNDDNNNNHQQKQQKKLDPRPCAECGKVLFSDKLHLLHCQTHAKNEKQCWICGINDDDIKKHIINEHGNQKFTNTGFKCQHCEKVFPVYADLEAHTREHSKRKPFECPICNKRFGQQGNLSCHLRIHSGVKPFTCTSCGKAFRHSNSLRRHARTVHSASRGLTMSPGSGTPTGSSLLLATATTSNSMVSMPNDIHCLSTSETYDDATSGLMIPSDDAESLQGPPSVSTTGAPSPSVSNAQMDSDSHEQ